MSASARMGQKRSFSPVTQTVEFWHILRCGEGMAEPNLPGNKWAD
jgi:hypothetical protein